MNLGIKSPHPRKSDDSIWFPLWILQSAGAKIQQYIVPKAEQTVVNVEKDPHMWSNDLYHIINWVVMWPGLQYTIHALSA